MANEAIAIKENNIRTSTLPEQSEMPEVSEKSPSQMTKHLQHEKKDADMIQVYVETLYNAEVPPEKIVSGVVVLLRTQSTIESNKKNRWFKPLVLAISTIFIILPLFPTINTVVG